MPGEGALDFLPLWAVFWGTLLLVLFAVEAGYRLGRYRHSTSGQEKEAPAGAMAGATLGLLAFLLAFAFGLAASRFEARRQVLLDEANAIGTTYLRAGLLAPEHRKNARELLREYVDIRLAAAQSGNVAEALVESERLHRKLWRLAEAASRGEASAKEARPEAEIVGLFIQSLNETIDLHSKRVMVSLRSRILGTIWVVLYLLAFLGLGVMGYHAGLSGTTRTLATVVVTVTFSAVIWLIADLDRPYAGLMRVSQQSMIDLRNSMTEDW